MDCTLAAFQGILWEKSPGADGRGDHVAPVCFRIIRVYTVFAYYHTIIRPCDLLFTASPGVSQVVVESTVSFSMYIGKRGRNGIERRLPA